MSHGQPVGRFGVPMVWIGEVESTNDLARCMAAAGVHEGAVVVADRQTRGRGRWGRAWASPTGGLWCSVLLRPGNPPAWGRLSLAVGVAAAEAIESAVGLRVGIRWPNDLMIGGRKVGGILIEGLPTAVVAGIGINVNVPLEDLPPEVASRATSLHLVAAREVPRALVLEALLGRLAAWYGTWADAGLRVIDAWSRRDVARGQSVTVGGPGETVEGVAEGVDDDGALRVRVAGGEIRRIVAGDLMPAPGQEGCL